MTSETKSVQPWKARSAPSTLKTTVPSARFIILHLYRSAHGVVRRHFLLTVLIQTDSGPPWLVALRTVPSVEARDERYTSIERDESRSRG